MLDQFALRIKQKLGKRRKAIKYQKRPGTAIDHFQRSFFQCTIAWKDDIKLMNKTLNHESQYLHFHHSSQ